MKPTPVLLCLGLLAGIPAHAQDVPDLSWLSGHWCTGDDNTGRYAEEIWLPARGGVMLGLGRTVTATRTNFEFMRIELADGTPRYVAQPGGLPPTTFHLVEAKPDEVIFANPKHDFPRRVRYARKGDTLTARIDDGVDGKPQEFKWQRCAEVR